MADKKEKEPVEDRDFWYRLRNEQRDMVRSELKKEHMEVGGRVSEEEKKMEEAKHALESARTKWKIKKALVVGLIAVLILLLIFMYNQGYFSDTLSLVNTG